MALKKIFNRILTWHHARIIILVLAIVGISAESYYALKSPAVSLLPPYVDGDWIRPNEAMSTDADRNPLTAAVFRKKFVTEGPQHDFQLAVTAFRDLKEIALDGNRLSFASPPSWKDKIQITVPGRFLSPGSHEVRITVVNTMAPPLIHVLSDLPEMGDAKGWEESTLEGRAWRPALRADGQRSPTVRESFPTVFRGLQSSGPFVLPIFLVSFLFLLLKPRYCNRLTHPETVRLALFVCLTILSVNNFSKIGRFITYLGFDTKEHLDYVYYILKNYRIPLATEGWQMFQPPLYYVLNALLLLCCEPFLPVKHYHFILAIIPFSCMILLIEISFRMLKMLLPGKKNLQSCGLLIAGLLPMNIYMCQVVGNEPLTAVLSALLLYMSIKVMAKENPSQRDFLLLGTVAGLAILAKITPLILIPVICFFMVALFQRTAANISSAKAVGLFLLVIALVTGWFFGRNYVVLGKPFFGGWDPARKIVWWQDPGYRLIQDYFSFGQALVQPVYSAFSSFADGLYSTFWGDGYNICEHLVTYPEPPHWNYELLAASTGLSVVPAMLMTVGMVTAYFRSRQRSSWPFTFLLVSAGVYLAALVHLFTLVPIFSTVKASYAMGLTPCYAVMAAVGAERFIDNRFVGPLVMSLLVTWGSITYMAFFML